MRKLFKPHSFIVSLLGLYKFRFYRKWWGGHWELWWVDFPVCAEIWHDVKECSLETKQRQNALLRGTPECEQYRQPLESAVAVDTFPPPVKNTAVSK